MRKLRASLGRIKGESRRGSFFMAESLAVRRASVTDEVSADVPGIPRSSTAVTRVHQVLDVLAARDVHGEILTAVRHYPAREAQWADFPGWTNANLREAYADKGSQQLYSH